MEVILLESFDKLGQIGDVVRVKNGFARNFLIPNKKALRANKENKEKFQKIKDELLEKNKEIIKNSKDLLKKIENKEIIFIRNASDNGQLYGSVSPKDISNYFLEKKIAIKPSNINLHTSIKKIGIYDLNIKLHAEVGCNLKINVATSEQNAKQQKIDVEKEKLKDSNNTEPDSKVHENPSEKEAEVSKPIKQNVKSTEKFEKTEEEQKEIEKKNQKTDEKSEIKSDKT